MKFRQFILNEDDAYLGQRIGDILNAMHDLQQHSQAMGTRLLMANTEAIVKQIRRVLHTHWPKEDLKYLVTLQNVGVSMMKAIDGKNKEKEDLNSILAGSTAVIEKLSNDIGTPQNNLASPPTPPDQSNTGVQPSEGDDLKPDQQNAISAPERDIPQQ